MRLPAEHATILMEEDALPVLQQRNGAKTCLGPLTIYSFDWDLFDRHCGDSRVHAALALRVRLLTIPMQDVSAKSQCPSACNWSTAILLAHQRPWSLCL